MKKQSHNTTYLLRPMLQAPGLSWIVVIQMLLASLWHDNLSDEPVKNIANVNLHVMRLPGLDLEDTVVPKSFGAFLVSRHD